MTYNKLLFSIVTLSIMIFAFTISQSNEHNYIPPDGYVPDETTAIKVAEAIWFPIYGEENIKKQKPYEVKLVNDSSIWIVEGTLPKGYLGGVAYIKIQKIDCKVLKVTHGK